MDTSDDAVSMQPTTTEDQGETLREVITRVRENLDRHICNTSGLELQQVLHPLNSLYTVRQVIKDLRSIERVVDRLVKFKSDPSNDVSRLERLSRVRYSLRTSKKQLQSFTKQLQENSVLFRVHEINSSKHEKLLARLELCSLCSECDFFVTKSSLDELSESVSSAAVDVVTISTTSLLIDIMVHPETGIGDVSFRFFSQGGEEFTDDKLCQVLKSWLVSERFSIFEEKLKSVWKLDKIDQSVKLDVVQLLHCVRSLFRNVYDYERSKSLFSIQRGHGGIVPDLQGIVDIFYTCFSHNQSILRGFLDQEDWIEVCKCCDSCRLGVVSVREEPEEKEIFFPSKIPEISELEQENKFPVDLENWIGVGVSAELCFLFSLDRPVKMTLTSARLLYLCYEGNSRPSRPMYRQDMLTCVAHVLLEESLLEDCGYSLGLSSTTEFTRQELVIESGLEYQDGRTMMVTYSLAPFRISLKRRCVEVDSIPFLRIDKLITVLGILRQQLVFNHLFQSLFCHGYVDGKLNKEPMKEDGNYIRLVTCSKSTRFTSNCRVEVVVHPPYQIKLYIWRKKKNEELENTQVIISIAPHGVLKVSMDDLENVEWFEKLLNAVGNIPVGLFHWWEKKEKNDMDTHPHDR